jgi:hypothetical protein
VPLHPWIPTYKDEVVEIVPDEVTGRAFRMHRPWRHLLGDD